MATQTSPQQVAADMILAVQRAYPTALTTQGASSSFLSDVLIGAPQFEIANMLGQVYYAQLTNSFGGFIIIMNNATIQRYFLGVFGFSTQDQLNEKLLADLNALAEDYKQPPNAGSVASTTMTFQFGSAATVTIPAGTRVYTDTAQPIYYTSTQTITLRPVLQTSGSFVLPVPVQCVTIGLIGNTGPGTITNFTGLSGLISVTNEADVNNGLDPLSVLEYATLMQGIQQQGFSLDTQAGLTALFTGFGIQSVSVIAANNPNSTRFFGVDAWVLLNDPAVAVDQITWQPSYSTLGYAPNPQTGGFQPLEISTAGFALSGFPTAIFVTQKAAASLPESYSYQSQDRIIITFPAGTIPPTAGDQLSLAYSYNGGIILTQNKLNDPNLQLFAQILVKEGILRPFQLTMPFKVLPGFVPSEVQTTVQATINQIVNSLNLGQPLTLTTLIVAVATTPGVQEILESQITYNFVDIPLTDSSGNPLQFVDQLPSATAISSNSFFNQFLRLAPGGLNVQVTS